MLSIKVTSDAIYFKHLFYTVVVKNNNIKFQFFDQRLVAGLPLALKTTSNDIEITSQFGSIGKILAGAKPKEGPCSYYSFPFTRSVNNQAASSVTIYKAKYIKQYLDSLSLNGYNVEKEKKELERLSGIPGAHETNLIEFSLYIVAAFFFSILLFMAFGWLYTFIGK